MGPPWGAFCQITLTSCFFYNTSRAGIYSISVTLKSGVCMVNWRSLKMALFDRSLTSSYWRSIVTMTLPCIVSEIAYSELLVENREISMPHLYLAPRNGRGWPRQNFAKMFDMHKTRVIGLPCGPWNCDDMLSRFDGIESCYINIARHCWHAIKKPQFVSQYLALLGARALTECCLLAIHAVVAYHAPAGCSSFRREYLPCAAKFAGG